MIRSKKEKLIPFENFSFTLILFTYWWPLIPHMSLYNNWNNVLMMLPLGFFMRYLYSTNKWIFLQNFKAIFLIPLIEEALVYTY